jgi:hypothetical protein
MVVVMLKIMLVIMVVVVMLFSCHGEILRCKLCGVRRVIGDEHKHR